MLIFLQRVHLMGGSTMSKSRKYQKTKQTKTNKQTKQNKNKNKTKQKKTGFLVSGKLNQCSLNDTSVLFDRSSEKKKCYTQTYLGFRATLNDAVEQ